MPAGKRIATIESKALSIAIKRAMVTRDIKSRALAELSGVPYSSLRKILELNTVADYEQLRKIALALHMPLSKIIADAEQLAQDKDIISEYVQDTMSKVTPATQPAFSNDFDIDEIIAHHEQYGLVANYDENKNIESQIPDE